MTANMTTPTGGNTDTVVAEVSASYGGCTFAAPFSLPADVLGTFGAPSGASKQEAGERLSFAVSGLRMTLIKQGIRPPGMSDNEYEVSRAIGALPTHADSGDSQGEEGGPTNIRGTVSVTVGKFTTSWEVEFVTEARKLKPGCEPSVHDASTAAIGALMALDGAGIVSGAGGFMMSIQAEETK